MRGSQKLGQDNVKVDYKDDGGRLFWFCLLFVVDQVAVISRQLVLYEQKRVISADECMTRDDE